MLVVRALSIHEPYACRERGACCTAGWPIPVEAGALNVLEAALDSGLLLTPHLVARPIDRPAHAPLETPGLIAHANGRCAFHRTSGSNRCDIHRTLGHAALPLACQQFPRVSVIDPRGASVTLSHYCPTAAELLHATGDIRIIDRATTAEASVPDTGLDVRHALPPLLAPGMLMDWESWWLWEQRSLEVFNRSSSSDEALLCLSSALERVREWRPAVGPLRISIEGAFTAGTDDSGDRGPNAGALVAAVWASIPEDLRPALPRSRPVVVSPAVRRRFVAAHAFANWTAHLGRGLHAWLLSVRAADALIGHGLPVSEADLWLRHLSDPRALAEALGRDER